MTNKKKGAVCLVTSKIRGKKNEFFPRFFFSFFSFPPRFFFFSTKMNQPRRTARMCTAGEPAKTKPSPQLVAPPPFVRDIHETPAKPLKLAFLSPALNLIDDHTEIPETPPLDMRHWKRRNEEVETIDSSSSESSSESESESSEEEEVIVDGIPVAEEEEKPQSIPKAPISRKEKRKPLTQEQREQIREMFPTIPRQFVQAYTHKVMLPILLALHQGEENYYAELKRHQKENDFMSTEYLELPLDPILRSYTLIDRARKVINAENEPNKILKDCFFGPSQDRNHLCLFLSTAEFFSK